MKTILVLEDEPSVMGIIKIVLSRDYTVLESTTVEQALQRFHEHDGDIDLLIADVILPFSSGLHVGLELCSMNPALRVMLTAGYPPSIWPEQDSAELNRLPSDSVAVRQKPFFPSKLRNTVEMMIDSPADFDPVVGGAAKL